METSAEEMLTDIWTSIRIRATEEIEEADYKLYRIGIIYSGQLSLDNLLSDTPDRYGPLGDRRSIAHGDDW